MIRPFLNSRLPLGIFKESVNASEGHVYVLIERQLASLMIIATCHQRQSSWKQDAGRGLHLVPSSTDHYLLG